jgi:hypothetical protein
MYSESHYFFIIFACVWKAFLSVKYTYNIPLIKYLKKLWDIQQK